MARFHLLDIELGRSTTSLLDLAISYSNISFDFFTIHTERYDIVHGYSETIHWRLFGFDYYRNIADWATVRADLYVFNRQFVWKRKGEEVPDDMPF